MNTNRAAVVGTSFALWLVLALFTGCSTPRRQVVSPPANVTMTSEAIAFAGKAIAATSDAAPDPARAVHAIDPWTAAEDEATRVFRSMHPQLIACYTRRLASHPDARAYLVVDVLVGADGRPRDVSTIGGAMLGRDTVDCMTRHVRSARFAPPEHGGSSRVRVPFTFRPDVSADEG